MLTVTLLLALAAFICAIWSKVDLRIAVVLLCLIELLRLLPR